MTCFTEYQKLFKHTHIHNIDVDMHIYTYTYTRVYTFAGGQDMAYIPHHLFKGLPGVGANSMARNRHTHIHTYTHLYIHIDAEKWIVWGC